MERNESATILMFGSLYAQRQASGLASTLVLPIAATGKRAVDIAEDLGLPLAAIGGIYCNHQPASLERVIRPGDRVAFMPSSIPGPHHGLQGLPILEGEFDLPKSALG